MKAGFSVKRIRSIAGDGFAIESRESRPKSCMRQNGIRKSEREEIVLAGGSGATPAQQKSPAWRAFTTTVFFDQLIWRAWRSGASSRGTLRLACSCDDAALFCLHQFRSAIANAFSEASRSPLLIASSTVRTDRASGSARLVDDVRRAILRVAFWQKWCGHGLKFPSAATCRGWPAWGAGR